MIPALCVVVVIFSECFAVWQLSGIASQFAAWRADTDTPSEMMAEAWLNLEALRSDTELLTITQTMNENEAVTGDIAKNQTQFRARMNAAEAAVPSEIPRIEALKNHENALFHHACRNTLLQGGAATSMVANAVAQTNYLTQCAPMMPSMMQDIAAEQLRLRAQAALQQRALPKAIGRAFTETVAMMLASLALITLFALFPR